MKTRRGLRNVLSVGSMVSLVASTVLVLLPANPASAAALSCPGDSSVSGSASFPLQAFTDPAANGALPADWIGSSSGGYYYLPNVETGWLRLTDASRDEATAVYYNNPFPSDQGIVVDFDYAMWGGDGADGLSFFLFDGSYTGPFYAGAPGGGLGYTQNTITGKVGVPCAYVGVGLDEWGNWIYTGDGRPDGLSGAANGSQDNFGIRGPGNGTIGYNLVAPNSYKSSFAFQGDRYAGKRVRMYFTPVSGSNPQVKAEILNGSGQVIDQIGPFSMPSAPPPFLKLGFSASTGGSTNIHELRGLTVAKPITLATMVTSPQENQVVNPGDTIIYTVTSRNTGVNDASLAQVEFTIGSGLTDVSWTCTSSSGASCGADSGTDPLDNPSIPAGGIVTYTVTGTAAPAPAGPISLMATSSADGYLNLSNTASATLQVYEARANDQGLEVSLNTAKTAALDVTDPSGALTTGKLVTEPAHGTVSFNGLNLTYTPANNYTGSDSFTWYADNGSGLAVTNTATVSVSVSNSTAPSVSAGTPTLPAVNEDDTANSGILVSTLLSGYASDPNGLPVGLAVTAADTANGRWEVFDGTTWWNVPTTGTLSDTNAELIPSNYQLRFVPSRDWNGSATITYRAWNQTSGTARSMVDASQGGGSTAFSAETQTASVTVNPVNDAPTQGRPGNSKFITFDGSNDYLDLPDLTFGGPGSEYTVEAWVNPAAYSTWARIAEFGNGPASDNVLFGMVPPGGGHVGGELGLHVYYGAQAPTILETTRRIPLDTWSHVAATIDSTGRATIYVNGQVWASGIGMHYPNEVTRTQNYVAKSNWSQDGYFKGREGDLRVWNRALTQAEIQTEMNNTLTGMEPGLLLYYPTTEGSGTTTASGLSGVPDATLMNGAGWSTVPLPPAPMTVAEDQSVALTPAVIADVDAGSGDLTLTLQVSHGTLHVGQTAGLSAFTNDSATIEATGPLDSLQAALESVTYSPSTDFNGQDSLTINVNDNGNTGTGGALTTGDIVVPIEVLAVNDPPSFTKGPNQTVQANAGPQIVTVWATAISAGPTDEADQTLTFEITNSTPALFSVQPAISPSGTLTFTPASAANGTATISVTLKDSGGRANGGVDTSAAQTFTITVQTVGGMPSPVQAKPTISSVTNVTVEEGKVTTATVTVSDADTPPTSLLVTASSSNPSVATVSVDGTGGARTLTIHGLTSGTVTVTVSVSDGQQTASTTFTVTVLPASDLSKPSTDENKSGTPGAVILNGQTVSVVAEGAEGVTPKLVKSGSQDAQSLTQSEDGSWTASGVPAGKYTLVFEVTAPTGEKLAGPYMKVSVDASGKVKKESELIDPYGVVMDRESGLPLQGVKMQLMWADTPLNRAKGRVPNTLVALPELHDFAPNQNHMPQWTTAQGEYAWMVFPDADYYVVATKDGYLPYDSRSEGPSGVRSGDDSYVSNGIIHVGNSLVMLDLHIWLQKGSHLAYMKGYPDGTFGPQNSVTRAEVATALARVLKLPLPDVTSSRYPDVAASHWALRYIEAASQAGYLTGYLDGTFHPQAPVTRAEMAVIVAKLRKLSPLTGDGSFHDVTGHWAAGFIQTVQAAGVMKGYPNGTFQPQQFTSRAEFTTIMNKTLYRGPLMDQELSFTDLARSFWAYGEIAEASLEHNFERDATTVEHPATH